MMTHYLEAAMREAQFEIMENGRCWGDIPSCKGCWADGATLEECSNTLASVLEDWIMLGIQYGHQLPVIAGIDINPPVGGSTENSVVLEGVSFRQNSTASEQPQRGEASQPGASDEGVQPRVNENMESKPCKGETPAFMVRDDRCFAIPAGEADDMIDEHTLARVLKAAGISEEEWDATA